MSRNRVLGIGVWSVLAIGYVAANLPGCGGGDTGGLGGNDTGTGDVAETGDGGSCGYATSFVLPADHAKLGTADDKSGSNCTSGLVTDVTVATSAPDGTSAVLYANDKQVAAGTASGAKVVFASVALPSTGTVVLRVSVAGNDCASESITIDCGLPACSVATPKGPYLNGVPVASGGDRVNNVTDPFATQVVIDTDLADGEFVTLSVDGTAPLKVAASGGHATFTSVVMAPDGSHNVKATCTNSTGNAGSSGLVQYTVLTSAVDLTLTKPTADGKVFGVADDVDAATTGVQFDVCGTTADANAIDVPADARGGQKNLCAGVGTGTPSCVAMTKVTGGSTGSACVRMTCPTGSAPFDIGVTLADKAGNQATAKRAMVRCESNLPSVSVVSPVAYDASKPSTILNVTAGEAGSAPGALKKTVVACSDKFPAKAQLFAGLAGSTLTAVGSPVDVAAAATTDGCPTGLGYVAKFVQTLPESVESLDGKGTLVTASELRVDVTDGGANVGSSPKVDLWVDSRPPVLSLASPACGKVYTGTSDITDTALVASDTLPFVLKVAGTVTTGTYNGVSFDLPSPSLPAYVTIPNVKFYVGGNSLSLTATDAAGNSVSALTACSTYVGSPPVVSITSPVDGTKLGADTNVDAATHKYKTSVTGTVTGSTTATTVSLRVAGTVVATAPISAGGYTFANVLLPEADALSVRVELSDTNYGTIGRTETLLVDTHPPTMSGALSASVDAATRRAGGFALGWTAGTDFDPATSGVRPCDHYEVRRAATTITTDAAWAAATVVSSSVGSALTATIATTGRLPASSNFAIRCYDKAANAGPIVSTISAATADFITSTLTGPTGLASFGKDVSSGLDLTGDAIPDLVVAASGKACVYFGHRPTSATDSGFAATPDVCFVGTSLGSSVSSLSDFDGDGLNDLAIGASLDGKAWLISGAAITASATDVAVSGLGTKSLVYAGDATTSIFGARVRNVNGFFGGTSRGALLVRAQVGGLFSTLVVKSHPFDGSTISMPANASFFAQATSTTSALALSIAAQDVDGDGLTDVLLGDYLVGSAYLFKGRSALSATSIPVSSADGVITSATPSDRFGYSVGLPGKITGTRFDAVIGASLGAGYAEVDKIIGTTLTRSARLSHSTSGEQLGLTTLMIQPGQTFDADGDGIADILTCSGTATTSTSGCFLVYGSATLADRDVSVSAPDIKFFGVDTGGSYGAVAHALGDIDADGFVDWAMCSPNSSLCTIVR